MKMTILALAALLLLNGIAVAGGDCAAKEKALQAKLEKLSIEMRSQEICQVVKTQRQAMLEANAFYRGCPSTDPTGENAANTRVAAQSASRMVETVCPR